MYKLEKSISEPESKKLAENVRTKVGEFREHLPLIQRLGNTGMKARHWEQVSEIIGFDLKMDSELTLNKILSLNLEDYISEFDPIAEAAAKETALERAIMKIGHDWSDMYFTVNPYKETGTFVIASVDDIQLMLEDHITKVLTMKNSTYIKPFEDQIQYEISVFFR